MVEKSVQKPFAAAKEKFTPLESLVRSALVTIACRWGGNDDDDRAG